LKNLFIIGTPLQLLNAIEAVKQFKLENNILVVVHRSLHANKVQINNLKRLYQWEEIIEIEYNKNSSILKYVDLVKYLKNYIYNYIFISKLEVVPKIVIPNVIKEKVFILDDGVMTISLYENNIKKNKINKYNFKELRFLFFGLKIKIRDTINLFTYFDLKPTSKIEVAKNKLTFLKETYLEGALKDNDNIYFLGHPSGRHISDDNYISSLLNLIKFFNKNVVYIPHRGESEKMKKRVSSIANPLLCVKDINMPVELYFLENKIYPSNIIAYYSTALITLNIIYKECNISYLPIAENGSDQRSLRKIYNIFDKENLEKLYIV